jgi:hypothetical protein
MARESEAKMEDIKSPAFTDDANDDDWYMPNGGAVILNFYDDLADLAAGLRVL